MKLTNTGVWSVDLGDQLMELALSVPTMTSAFLATSVVGNMFLSPYRQEWQIGRVGQSFQWGVL